jgi:hypothetical protein
MLLIYASRRSCKFMDLPAMAGRAIAVVCGKNPNKDFDETKQ